MNAGKIEIIDFSDFETEVQLRQTGIIKGVTKPENARTFESGQTFKIGTMGGQKSAFSNYVFIITDCRQTGDTGWIITAVLKQP